MTLSTDTDHENVDIGGRPHDRSEAAEALLYDILNKLKDIKARQFNSKISCPSYKSNGSKLNECRETKQSYSEVARSQRQAS